MPPPRRKASRPGKSSLLETVRQELTLGNLRKLAVSPAYSWVAAGLLLVAELLLNTVVIHRVKYTEIDWVAYMQVPLWSINSKLVSLAKLVPGGGSWLIVLVFTSLRPRRWREF
jgi:hypothetical protein